MKRLITSLRFPALTLQLAALAVLLQIPGSNAWAADDAELQMQLVEERIETLKAQGATAADSATLQAYQAALNWLHEAENFNQLAAQFTSDQASAVKEETVIQLRLDSANAEMQMPDTDALEALSTTELDQEVSDLRNSLQGLQSQRASLDQQIAAEASNASNIRTRLNDIDLEEGALPESNVRLESGGSPTQFEASQWQLAAHRQALSAERRSLNARLNSQPASGRLRRAQREELNRKIEQLQQRLATLESLQVSKLSAQADPAIQDLKPDSTGYELLRQLSSENEELAAHRAELNKSMAKADVEKTRADGKLFDLMDHFNSAQRLVESGGKASVYGPFLMNYFMRLDQYRPPAEKLRQSNRISEIVIDRARHEQQLSELLNPEQFITSQLEALGGAQVLPDDVKSAARQLLKDRNVLLTELLSGETELIQMLGKTDLSYQQLESLIQEFRAFLIGHILWVRSHLPIDSDVFKQVLLDLRQAGESLQGAMSFSLRGWAMFFTLSGLLLLLMRRHMWRRIAAINTRIGRPRDDTILWSVETLILTVLRSAAVPLLVMGVALSIQSYQQGLLHPLARALLLASFAVVMALFVRDATTAGGICRVHFGWPEQRCKAVSGLMTWLLLRLLPVALIGSFLVQLQQHTPHAVLGQLMLSIVAIMIALKARRMLVRQREREAEAESRRSLPSWLQDGLLFGLTGALLAIMLNGYLLPARIIFFSLSITALVLVGLVILHEMLMRWLLVARRRIRFQNLVASLPDAGNVVKAEVDKADSEARQASLGDITDATENLIRSLVYASGLLAVVLIWKPLMPAIQGLQRFSLWTVNQTVNGEQLQTHITLATLIMATLIIMVTFYAARRIPALIDLIMRSSGNSTPSARYTVSTLTNYVIIAIGIMVFFSTLKMSWSQLQWLVAALGVGIGFGLQEIVANFISGLIILFERPIRVGDVVTIGESSGTVTRIQIRATTIRDWDGKELLVPNKEFITGRLLNWTLSDTNNRIIIDVGIAYGSDVTAAMKILEGVVSANPAILEEPAPNILFTQFGASALQLSVRCFLADLEDRAQQISRLHQEIYAALNQAGIVIAFPQLDVHIDPHSPLTVRLHKEAGQAGTA